MVATTYSHLSGADRHLQETLKLASAGAGVDAGAKVQREAEEKCSALWMVI
jgi:hypothetical protein